VVEVEQGDGQRGGGAAGAVPLDRQGVVPGPAVGRAGERIVVGQGLQLGDLQLDLADQPGHACHHEQEQGDRADPDGAASIPLRPHASPSGRIGATSETPVSSDSRRRVSRRGRFWAGWDSAAIEGCRAAAPNST
jgi:hypothetical protein